MVFSYFTCFACAARQLNDAAANNVCLFYFKTCAIKPVEATSIFAFWYAGPNFLQIDFIDFAASRCK